VARVSGDGTVDLSLNRLIPAEARDLMSIALETGGVDAEDGSARIWVFSTGRLGLIEAGRYRIVCDGFDFTPSDYLKASLLPVHGETVYFGDHLDILRYDLNQGVLERLGRNNGLVNDGVTDLCLDREGNIWLAGLRGVSKLVPTSFRSLGVADGLLESEVSAIGEPWPGTLVLGHDSGLTFLEDGSVSTLAYSPVTDIPLRAWRTLDMASDGQGNCWIAVNGPGLLLLTRDRRMRWFGPEEGLTAPVTSVLVMPSGDVLAASEEGISRRAGDRFELLEWPGVPIPPVRRMFLARDDSLYLATNLIGLLQVKDGRVLQFPGLDGPEELRVAALLENPDGSAWVGTWAGLFQLRDGRLDRPDPPLDQVVDPLFFITRDHQDRIWFGTSDGVQRWDGKELRRFGISDGLAGRETNRAAGFEDSRSRMWVGTETGLSLFIDDEPYRHAPPPLIAITGLTAGNEPMPLDGAVELGHRCNTLVFSFGAISLTDEHAVRYKYFLEGFDETWVGDMPIANRQVRYTNLPVGRYRFHVRAVGAPGHWSEAESSPWITILKPFWLRWWFFLAVGAMLFQVGYWGVAAVSRKRYARRLRREVAERTAELEESREHYRLLFHGAAVPKLILDLEDGVVFDANRAAEELCGLPPGGLEGRRPAGEGPDWLAGMLELCRGDQVPEELKVTGTHKMPGGQPRDVEAWGALLVLHGRPSVMVTALDITGRRRLEIEQLRASKLESLGIMAGGIAHDFNNMLTAIMGNLSLAREDLPGDGETASLVDSAYIASRSARKLTSQLLTFARGGAPVRRTTDMGRLIRDATTLIMSGSACSSTLDIESGLWPTEVDEGQMTQLINNLVLNACQAMPEGGQVTVGARNMAPGDGDGVVPVAGPLLCITVADEGPGVPAELLGKVFDPYFSTKDTGSGLGLATAYAIARGHGGVITVQSPPGRGAIFQILIPASPDAVLPLGEAVPALPGGPGRILVMDDEKPILEFYHRALTRLGYEPASVESGTAAVERYAEAVSSGEPFDAVIMDLTVPGGMGGREAIRLIRQQHSAVKAIVASGYSNDPVLSDPEGYGFSAVLTKPFSLRGLAEVLHELLGHTDAPGDSA